MRREVRTRTNVELRLDDADNRRIVGYAAVFEPEVADLGYFSESIVPGAFARTLRENPDVRALWNHETGKILGRTVAGTLRLVEDTKGLLATIDLPKTATGQEVAELVERGDVSSMSFGFVVHDDVWATRGGKHHRTLLDVDLYEVSPVTFPAYEGTTLGVREARTALEIFDTRKARFAKNVRAKNRLTLVKTQLA